MRFCFRICTAGRSRDGGEAHELSDLREALVQAQAVARGLIRKRLRRGHAPVRGTLDVEDEGRRTVARLMLADVARQISGSRSA